MGFFKKSAQDKKQQQKEKEQPATKALTDGLREEAEAEAERNPKVAPGDKTQRVRARKIKEQEKAMGDDKSSSLSQIGRAGN